jgi:hypothetical protein
MLFRLPSLVLTDLSYRYQFAAARTRLNFGRSCNTWLGYFPAFIAATVAALRSRTRRPGYTVTPKDGRPRGTRSRFVAVLPQTTLIVLSLVAIPYAATSAAGSIDLLLLNTVWSLWTVQKMWPLCRAVWTSPRGR